MRHTRHEKLPPYVYLIAFITLSYLTIEIPFSIHLVGVMGGNPSQEDIDAIEHVGRILTGVAVAIFVTGVFVFPRVGKSYPLITTMFCALVVGGAVTLGTFKALDAFAAYTGDSSNGEDRKEAFIANLAKRHLAENGVGGLKASTSGDWTAFVSVAPGLATASELVAKTGLTIAELARSEAVRFVGQPSSFKDFVFGKPFDPVRFAYIEYKEAGERLDVHRDVIGPRDAESAWYDYRGNLKRRVGEKKHYSAGVQREVRKQLREKGIPVPNSWNLNDRSGFERIYVAKHMKEANKTYRDEVTNQAGGYIEPGLDSMKFMHHPVVQKKIRDVLGIPQSSGVIVKNMSSDDFEKLVFNPKREALSEDFAKAARSRPLDFTDGWKYAEFGRNAVQAVSLPTMAILLSIAGAVLHIFKFTGYAAQIVGHHARIGFFKKKAGRFGLAGLVTASIFGGMFISGNLITSSEAFASFERSGPMAPILTGAIGIQPSFTVLGHGLATIGPWKLIESKLPKAVPFSSDETTEVAVAETTASVDDQTSAIPVPLQRPEGF